MTKPTLYGTNYTNSGLIYDNTGQAADTNLVRHVISQQAGTPVTSNLGANVTSATPTGNDVRFGLTVVMSGALAANTRICTIAFTAAYVNATYTPLIVNTTSGVGLTIVNFYFGSRTVNGFDLFANQALATGTYLAVVALIG